MHFYSSIHPGGPHVQGIQFYPGNPRLTIRPVNLAEARISLSISLLAIVAGGFVGSSLGLIAGYFGGVTDHLIMRLVDIFITIPGLLFALVLAVVLGPSFLTVVFVIAVILWPRFARMARGEAPSIRGRDFVSRARVSGASNLRIIVRHVSPMW